MSIVRPARSGQRKTMMIRTAVVIVAWMTLIGCGGKGPDDPLTGTWSNSVCFGDETKPADIQTCALTLRFEADLKFSLIDTRQSMPATAVYPRCSAIRTVTGLTYSTNSMGTVTISGSSASTLERKACADATDNQAPMADGRDSVAAGAISYAIKDKTLSLTTGPLRGDYARQ